MNTCCDYEHLEAVEKSVREARCNLESVMCQLNQAFDYLEWGRYDSQAFREANTALKSSRPVLVELSKVIDGLLMEINTMGKIPFLPDPPWF